MPPRTNCSQPSYSEGNALGRHSMIFCACAATELRVRGRLQVTLKALRPASPINQSTLQRLLSLTPNLKLIVRDVTHASRRVTAKPEAVDEHLEILTRRLFTDKHSITQIIEHSNVWRREFASFVERQEDCSGGHVAAAQHRHESKAKPWGAFCVELGRLPANGPPDIR